MKVSRSGNLLSALPAAGVRFGVLNHTDGSAPLRFSGSSSLPPENSGAFGANVGGSRLVWHPTQFATCRARYSPRALGESGTVLAGYTALRGLKTGTRLFTILPISVNSSAGTSCLTGACTRRYEMIA